MKKEIDKNNFGFGDNGIWIGSVKNALLLRQNTCHRVLKYVKK